MGQLEHNHGAEALHASKIRFKIGEKGRCNDLHAGAQELGGGNSKLRRVIDCTGDMVVIGVLDEHGSEST